MSDRKVTIAIETTANTAPLESATKSVDALSKKTEESAKSGDKAKEGGLNAAKGFAAMGQTAAASSGSVSGVAAALGGMAQQLPALAGAAGPIGLAIAAFLAWKSAIDAVIKAKEGLEAGLRDTAAGNSEAAIKSLSKAYENLQDAIANAADEAQRYADAESSKDDARTQADLAALELEKAQRTASLDPSDKFGGRRLDLDMAEKRAAIEDAAAQRRADRELANIRARAAAAQAAKVAAAESMDDNQSEFASLGSQYAKISDRTRQQHDKAWTPWGKLAASEEGAREMDRLAAAMEAAASAMKSAAETMAASDRDQYTLSQQAEVNLINRGTLATQRRTGSVLRGNASADYSRDVDADRRAKQQQEAERQASIQEQRRSRADYTRVVLGAQGNLRDARNSGAGSSEISALKAELEKALQARAEVDKVIIENARKTAAQAAQTAEQVKDIQARAARPGSGG